MPETHTDLADLAARLERLECSNRRWRGGAGALACAFVALVLTGAALGRSDLGGTAQQPQTYNEIRVHRLILLDNQNRRRAEIGYPASAEVAALLKSIPAIPAELKATALADQAAGNDSVVLSFISPSGQLSGDLSDGGYHLRGPSGALDLDENGFHFGLPPNRGAQPNGSGSASLLREEDGGWAFDLFGPGREFVSIGTGSEAAPNQPGPHIQLLDDAGFRTIIGVTNLTAAAGRGGQRTSAASIVMGREEGQPLIWQAPASNAGQNWMAQLTPEQKLELLRMLMDHH